MGRGALYMSSIASDSARLMHLAEWVVFARKRVLQSGGCIHRTRTKSGSRFDWPAKHSVRLTGVKRWRMTMCTERLAAGPAPMPAARCKWCSRHAWPSRRLCRLQSAAVHAHAAPSPAAAPCMCMAKVGEPTGVTTTAPSSCTRNAGQADASADGAPCGRRASGACQHCGFDGVSVQPPWRQSHVHPPAHESTHWQVLFDKRRCHLASRTLGSQSKLCTAKCVSSPWLMIRLGWWSGGGLPWRLWLSTRPAARCARLGSSCWGACNRGGAAKHKHAADKSTVTWCWPNL
jgi:hypothetical protein